MTRRAGGTVPGAAYHLRMQTWTDRQTGAMVHLVMQ